MHMKSEEYLDVKTEFMVNKTLAVWRKSHDSRLYVGSFVKDLWIFLARRCLQRREVNKTCKAGTPQNTAKEKRIVVLNVDYDIN